MRRTLFLILLLACVETLYAQHYSSWIRGTLLLPIRNNWSTGAEFQYRRQSDIDASNPFRRDLMLSYRHWVYYKVNDNVQLEISPLGYYESNNIIQRIDDRYKAPIKEYRATAAVSLEQKLFKNLSIVNRTGMEYRMFFQNMNVIRLRSRFGLRYDFNGWSVNAYNEQFLNLSGVRMDHFFDQSRLGLSAGRSLGRNLKVELGYLHIDRLLRDKTSTIQENSIYLNLSIN